MRIEIWSDILCPFCYIGKRHFEAALAQFEHRDEVEISWKSFQLDPQAPAQSEMSVYEYLANSKGITIEQSKEMHANVVEMARRAGLNYAFDKAQVANSFKAHCLLQLAKENGLGEQLKERLLKAYFEDGKNIGDQDTLEELGQEIGLSPSLISTAFTDPKYVSQVEFDINEAQQLGISGVPMFVINRKYGISGAQPVEVFLQNLNGIYQESNPA